MNIVIVLKMVSKEIVKSIPHPSISEVIQIEGRNLFPISWLHKQEYCEYQIFLEHMKGVKAEPTQAMVEGQIEHEQLEKAFIKKAVTSTLNEILEKSKKEKISSREFKVISLNYGLIGFIDEIIFTPSKYIIIDDKPRPKDFLSDIHQVYGYCLAFEDMIIKEDRREIEAALRVRRTDKIFWNNGFKTKEKIEIIQVINRIHKLLLGQDEFTSNLNPNKCRGCRFKMDCDRVAL